MKKTKLKLLKKWLVPFYLIVLFSSMGAYGQSTITGTISSADDGQPIPGANIVVQGTNNGTSSDFDGNYIIEAGSDDVLIFSYLGYKTVTLTIGNQTEINLSMEVDAQQLDAVVVVGYGTQKKGDLTGAVTRVDSEDFVKGANTNALQLLNGKASGVHISQSSSAPGGAMDIKIRGASSINASNDVLVVIDGLPGGSLTALSPDDIASIEVLKDASASAIYGSRAANGVVLITTKKGKKGKMQITYESYIGLQTVTNTIDVLNGGEYLKVLSDINVESGGDVLSTPAEIASIGKGFDWQDIILRDSYIQNHQLSMSGGGENSTYYVGLNFLKNDGVLLETGENKYNARLNYTLTPSDKVDVNINLSINRSEIDGTLLGRGTNEGAGAIAASLLFDPSLGPDFDSEGFYVRNPLVAIENPMAIVLGNDRFDVTNTAYISGSVNYEVIEGLTATARMGANIENFRSDVFENNKTERGRGLNGSAQIRSNDRIYWISEFLASYERSFGEHDFKLLVGTTYEKNNTRFILNSASDFLSEVTTTNLLQSGNPETYTVASGKTVNTLQSALGRLNYTFKDKYLLTASVRRDGTSRFSEKNKYAIFPSVSVGWKISSEPFMENQDFFNQLKLRVGYGEIGNQGINNFETINTFTAGSSAVLGGSIVSGAIPARIANPDLVWETTKETNIGLDFGFANSRFSGSIDLYDRNTFDQLFSKPVPYTTGFSLVRVNFGQVNNKGVDFAFNSRNINGKNFTWDTNVVFSVLKNEVIELPTFAQQIVSGGFGFSGNYIVTREGAPISSFYGYEMNGIFQVGDDIANSAQPTALPGHPIFADQNGDNKIDATDRIILGDPFADYTFGITNSFTYKDFSLNVYAYGVQGIQNFSNLAAESLYPINKERNHVAVHYLDRWTVDNPTAQFPSGVNYTSYSDGENKVNSFTVQDASFIRLKNVTLNYKVPLKNTKFIKGANIYVSGENLLTITKGDYIGYDPDGNSDGPGISRADFANYPLATMYRVGLKLDFN
ncbi:MAG: TonB-dependent receptor [Maribacter sp.]|nr:TonB-dependent receptor [Maribacter sp.]